MKKNFKNLERSKSPIVYIALFISLTVVFCNGFNVTAKAGSYQTRIAIDVADTATIDANLNIVITSRDQATDMYTLDISKLTIGTDDETIAFFAKYSDNVVSFTADMAKKVVQMRFLPPAEGAHPFISVAERNDYLKDKLTTYKANSKP